MKEKDKMWRVVFSVFIVIFVPLAISSFPIQAYHSFVGYVLYIFVFTLYLCALTIKGKE